MAKYPYKCDDGCYVEVQCSVEEYRTPTIPCNVHGNEWKRVYSSFGFTMPIRDGYSPTTGTFVSGERDLREQFKIASAQATERTGIEHNFQPVDMRDTEALGITEEGLADDNRTRHDRGEAIVTAPGLDI